MSADKSMQKFQNVVSILVFVELALDGLKMLSEMLMRLVSILVFVELALDALNGEDVIAALYHVSILVFVELALDGSRHANLAGRSTTSFNPCFRGTCS